MENEISTRAEVDSYINFLSKVSEDVKLFRKKWQMFYLGWINCFKILNVSKEDFFFFADMFPQNKCTTRENLLIIEIGGSGAASLYLHTELDFELYEKYVLKKNAETFGEGCL